MELEAERRQLRHLLEMETSKATHLKDDLVTEKTRTGDLLSKVHTMCSAVRICDESDNFDSVFVDTWIETQQELEALKSSLNTKIREVEEVSRLAFHGCLVLHYFHPCYCFKIRICKNCFSCRRIWPLVSDAKPPP